MTTAAGRAVRSAWEDGRWPGTWLRDDPRWHRAIARLSWYAHHLVERPRAVVQIVRDTSRTRDAGHGWRAALIVARGVACALTGRIDHHYPGYPEHPLAYELASWDHATWNGGEMECWSAVCAAVCTGRAWHLHVYVDSGP